MSRDQRVLPVKEHQIVLGKYRDQVIEKQNWEPEITEVQSEKTVFEPEVAESEDLDYVGELESEKKDYSSNLDDDDFANISFDGKFVGEIEEIPHGHHREVGSLSEQEEQIFEEGSAFDSDDLAGLSVDTNFYEALQNANTPTPESEPPKKLVKKAEPEVVAPPPRGATPP